MGTSGHAAALAELQTAAVMQRTGFRMLCAHKCSMAGQVFARIAQHNMQYPWEDVEAYHRTLLVSLFAVFSVWTASPTPVLPVFMIACLVTAKYQLVSGLEWRTF